LEKKTKTKNVSTSTGVTNFLFGDREEGRKNVLGETSLDGIEYGNPIRAWDLRKRNDRGNSSDWVLPEGNPD